MNENEWCFIMKRIYKLWQDSRQSILFLALFLLASLLAYPGAFATQRKFVIIVFHAYHPGTGCSKLGRRYPSDGDIFQAS